MENGLSIRLHDSVLFENINIDRMITSNERDDVIVRRNGSRIVACNVDFHPIAGTENDGLAMRKSITQCL